MDRKLTWYIFAGMVLGVAVGYAVHVGVAADSPMFEYITKTFKLLSDIFLNLIKLLVAPLVLSTIVVGIAHMGDSSALGRIGVRALTWFITASFISIVRWRAFSSGSTSSRLVPSSTLPQRVAVPV